MISGNDCEYDSQYWDGINQSIENHQYRGLLNKHRIYCYSDILKDVTFKQFYSLLLTDVFDAVFPQQNLVELIGNLCVNPYVMDISYRTLLRVKVKYPKCLYVCCDGRCLPFKSNSFDLVLSPSTFDHCPKQHLTQFNDETNRVLRTKGRMIISLHNKSNIFLNWYLMRMFVPFKITLYSKAEVMNVFSGFHDIQVTSVLHLPLPVLVGPLLQVLAFLDVQFCSSVLKSFEKFGKVYTKLLTGDLIVVAASKK